MKILIDADACPKNVLAICLRLGQQHNIDVWTVASFNHDIASSHHIMVGGASQETDIKLINLTQAGDIVVTQDWGLAALALGKQAKCLNPGGMRYNPDKIDFLLEEREMKAKFRRGGGRTKGPKKRSGLEDEKFAAALEAMIGLT